MAHDLLAFFILSIGYRSRGNYNPIKAVGSESMYSRGGHLVPPNPYNKKGLEYTIGLKCMSIA